MNSPAQKLKSETAYPVRKFYYIYPGQIVQANVKNEWWRRLEHCMRSAFLFLDSRRDCGCEIKRIKIIKPQVSMVYFWKRVWHFGLFWKRVWLFGLFCKGQTLFQDRPECQALFLERVVFGKGFGILVYFGKGFGFCRALFQDEPECQTLFQELVVLLFFLDSRRDCHAAQGKCVSVEGAATLTPL